MMLDVGCGAVGSLGLEGTPGLAEFFLKHSLEPRELKGRSIPSDGKTGRNCGYFINTLIPSA